MNSTARELSPKKTMKTKQIAWISGGLLPRTQKRRQHCGEASRVEREHQPGALPIAASSSWQDLRSTGFYYRDGKQPKEPSKTNRSRGPSALRHASIGALPHPGQLSRSYRPAFPRASSRRGRSASRGSSDPGVGRLIGPERAVERAWALQATAGRFWRAVQSRRRGFSGPWRGHGRATRPSPEDDRFGGAGASPGGLGGPRRPSLPLTRRSCSCSSRAKIAKREESGNRQADVSSAEGDARDPKATSTLTSSCGRPCGIFSIVVRSQSAMLVLQGVFSGDRHAAARVHHGGAALGWPLAAHAQQQAVAVIGFVGGGSANEIVSATVLQSSRVVRGRGVLRATLTAEERDIWGSASPIKWVDFIVAALLIFTGGVIWGSADRVVGHFLQEQTPDRDEFLARPSVRNSEFALKRVQAELDSTRARWIEQQVGGTQSLPKLRARMDELERQVSATDAALAAARAEQGGECRDRSPVRSLKSAGGT